MSNMGKNNPRYIDGRTLKQKYCRKCNKPICYGSKGHCLKCCQVIRASKISGTKNSGWKGGLPNCIECGKGLSGYNYKRCRKCANKISNKARTGINNNFYGKIPKHTARIKYNGTNFRSGWEANFAKFLDLSGIRWQYEARAFVLTIGMPAKCTTYTPDFYLPEFGCHIEIKGYWRDDAKLKYDTFKEEYKSEVIHLFDSDKLKEIGII